MKTRAWLSGIILIGAVAAAQIAAPLTKLEAFWVRENVVAIKGSTEIGSVLGRTGGRVAVEAVEMKDAVSGTRQAGVLFRITGTARPPLELKSFVDEDELDALLKGMEQILKLDYSSTPLERFQAHYRTRGGLEIATFSRGKNQNARMSCGALETASVDLTMTDLEKVKEFIAASRAKLAEIQH